MLFHAHGVYVTVKQRLFYSFQIVFPFSGKTVSPTRGKTVSPTRRSSLPHTTIWFPSDFPHVPRRACAAKHPTSKIACSGPTWQPTSGSWKAHRAATDRSVPYYIRISPAWSRHNAKGQRSKLVMVGTSSGHYFMRRNTLPSRAPSGHSSTSHNSWGATLLSHIPVSEVLWYGSPDKTRVGSRSRLLISENNCSPPAFLRDSPA